MILSIHNIVINGKVPRFSVIKEMMQVWIGGSSHVYDSIQLSVAWWESWKWLRNVHDAQSLGKTNDHWSQSYWLGTEWLKEKLRKIGFGDEKNLRCRRNNNKRATQTRTITKTKFFPFTDRIRLFNSYSDIQFWVVTKVTKLSQNIWS